MKYDSLRAFEKHLVSATPKHFSSLYCVLGKNSFECQEATDLLLHFLVPPPAKKELSVSFVDGSQIDEQEMNSILNSYSFFAPLRVIWISQLEKLKKNVQIFLEKSFFHPSPSPSSPPQFFLLAGLDLPKNSSFYKAIEKNGIVLELGEMKPWEKEKQLVEWANKQLASHRKHISYPVCQLLVKQTGLDQALLMQEIDKLLCFCAEKKEITLEDVEAICVHQQTITIWQLGEAIFCRNVGVALSLAQTLLLDGHALHPLLRAIRSQFQTEYQVSLLIAQGHPPEAITQEFSYMKGKILDQHIRQVRQYGLNAFKRGLLAIDAAEMQLKTMSIHDNLVLELLIIQLTNHSLTNHM